MTNYRPEISLIIVNRYNQEKKFYRVKIELKIKVENIENVKKLEN